MVTTEQSSYKKEGTLMHSKKISANFIIIESCCLENDKEYVGDWYYGCGSAFSSE